MAQTVVELTGDERRLIDAFRKSEAAAKRLDVALGKTADASSNAGKRVADGMIKGGQGAAKGINAVLRNLRKVKDGGSNMADAVEKHFQDIGKAGRMSMDDAILAMIDLDEKAAQVMMNVQQEMKAASKAANFDQVKDELGKLGPEFATIKKHIDESLARPMKDAAYWAAAYIAEMKELDPGKAELIERALTKAREETNRTNFDKLTNELGQAGKAGRKLGEMIRQASLEAEGGMDGIIAKIVKLNPEMKGVVDQWRALVQETDRADAFDKSLRSLEALGPKFAQLGGEIRTAIKMPFKDAVVEARKLVHELKDIDPSKAQAIERAIRNAQKEAERQGLDRMMNTLADGNREAAELVSMFKDRMKQATLEAEGGVDRLISRIVAAKPELRAVAEQWRQNMATAAADAQTEFGEMFKVIRAKGGQTGQQVADAMRTHLAQAGRMTRREFEQMIEPLEQMDRHLAGVARKMHQAVNGAADGNNKLFADIGTNVVRNLASVAGAYIGIQEAVQLSTEAIRNQIRVLDEAREANMSLGEAQSQALKNLITLPAEQRKFLLGDFVQEVSGEFKIKDQKSLTKAVGDARSSGGTFEEVQSAVRAAAALNVLTPEDVDETAAAIIKTIKATGEKNAEIVASQILVAGAESQIIDPAKLFRNLPPALLAGRTVSAEGKEKQGALESAAIFSALSKAGGDDQGDATQTATIQLNNKVREFFTKIADETDTARKDLAALKTKQTRDALSPTQRHDFSVLSKNEADKRAVETSLFQVNQKINEIQKGQDDGEFRTTQARRGASVKKRKLNEQKAALEQRRFDDADQARLDALRKTINDKASRFSAEEQELLATIKRGQVGGKDISAQDPGTPLARINFIRQNNLYGLFKDIVKEFGEQRFRPGNESLLTGKGDTDDIALTTDRLLKGNSRSTAKFQSAVEEVTKGVTDQLEVSMMVTGHETAKTVKHASDELAAYASTVRMIVRETMEDARTGMGIANHIDEMGLRGMFEGAGLQGSAGPEEAVAGVLRLAERRSHFDQAIPERADEYNRLTSGINLLLQGLQGGIVRKSSRLDDATEQLRRDINPTARNEGNVYANAARDNPILAQRMLKILEDQLALQQQQLEEARASTDANLATADATAATAGNTAPIPTHDPAQAAAAQAAARAARGTRP